MRGNSCELLGQRDAMPQSRAFIEGVERQEVRGNFLFPSAKIQNIYHIDNQFIVFFNLISRLPLI